MANFMTYGDIKTAINRVSKKFKGSKETMIEHLINSVYLTEIMSNHGLWPFFWLQQLDVTRRALPPVLIDGISAANPGVFSTATAHGQSVGDIIEIADVTGMTQVNEVLAQVASVPSTTTFTTNLNTSSYDAYVSGGRALHRGITLPHSAEDIVYASWNDDRTRMTPVFPKDIEGDTSQHNAGNTGVPTHYIFGQSYDNDGNEINQLMWSPASDNDYLLRYWYKQSVNRLSADADVPLLPARFHDAIVAGVIARMEEPTTHVGVEKASLWPTIYSGHLDAIKAYNERYWANVERQQNVELYML